MNSSRPPDSLYTEAQRREAADWFVIIRDEDDPKAEAIQAWLRWMEQHEGNRAAFDAVARAWHSTTAAAALQMPSAEDLLADGYEGDQPIDEWLAAARAGERDASARSSVQTRQKVRAFRRVWLAAAS